MDKILGLGRSVKKILNAFAIYPQYEIFYLSEDDLGDHGDMESYESGFSPLRIDSRLFKLRYEAEILFVVFGGAEVNGCSLRILEMLKDSKITILYIDPDSDLLTKRQRMNNRISLGVLQEYARSGMFDMLYIVSEVEIKKAMGEVSLLEYDDKLADYLVSTFGMFNYFLHSDPIRKVEKEIKKGLRIGTLGFFQMGDSREELCLAPLSDIKQKVYYYGLTSEEISNPGLMTEIREQLSRQKETGFDCSYEVHEIDGYHNSTILCAYTDYTQQV